MLIMKRRYRVVNDFRKSGSQWFYLDENGHIVRNCEREIGGKIYVFNERGAMDPSATRKRERAGTPVQKALRAVPRFLRSAADSSI